MPFVVRKLKNKHYWSKPDPDTEQWIPADDIPGDSLKNLDTEKSTLSIYIVEDEQAAMRVMVALAAKGNSTPDKLDYAILDLKHLCSFNAHLRNTEGNTPDADVNRWHRDLTQLAAYKLADLAFIWVKHAKTERIKRRKILEEFQKCLESKYLEHTNLNSSLQRDLGFR